MRLAPPALLLLLLALSPACAKGSSSADPARPSAASEPFRWQSDEAAVLAQAKASGRRVLVDISATWCVPCQDLDKKTFADPAVQAALAGTLGLKLDVTAQDEAAVAIQSKYAAPELPAVILFGPDGAELLRITAFVPPEVFLERLKSL